MRKYLLVIAGVAAMAITAAVLHQGAAKAQDPPPSVKAYFSPKGGVMRAVSSQIKDARTSIDAALYMLTAPKLAWDLVSAHKRGVKVRVILDARMAGKWSEVDTLRRNGIQVWELHLPKEEKDPSPPQFHHKFAVIDGGTVLTGSYNWTVMADERNFENLLVVRDGGIAAKYSKAFEKALAEAGKSARGEGAEEGE